MLTTAKRLAFLLLGALSVAAFFDAAKLHGGYVLPTVGIRFVPMSELVFALWYAVWGTLATVCFACALPRSVSAALTRTFERAAERPREAGLALAMWAFVASLSFRHAVLLDQPITDDELVYELTARALATGHVTAEPPVPWEFVANQFVVADAQRWHGKYPIGHSLVLAPFELLGRVDLVGPLLAACTIALTLAVGRALLGPRQGLLATLLLACSPHFLWTHGTLLSQTTSSTLILLAVWASLCAREATSLRWLALCGASLGFAVLTRPMPGVLACAAVVTDELARGPRGTLAKRALVLTGALVPVASLILLVNYLQSGSPWTSGYREVHSTYGAFQNIDGELTNSIGGALVRENLWLFGWPLSLVFVPFAQFGGPRRLVLALIASAFAYRAVVPKTVVASTGPVYMLEAVPWLCVATAMGMAKVAELGRRLGHPETRERVIAGVVGAALSALACFAPVTLRALLAGADLRETVFQELAAAHIERAVVFANLLVDPNDAKSWAYTPPNPWPDLRDPLLFLRVPDAGNDLDAAWRLWRERFSDRPAVFFSPMAYGSKPRLFDPKVPPGRGPTSRTLLPLQ